MSPGADVQAISALEEWYAALVTFREEANEALSGVRSEISRVFDRIEDEGKSWMREARQAEDDVVRAKAELAMRKTPDYSGRIPDTSVQEENLARAKSRLQFAQEQIEICKKWLARLPKMISEEYDGPSRRLGSFLEIELANAIADLSSRIDRLHAYMSIKPTETPS